jgi:glycosyltransferase involved in cell wall biosynthesis
MKGALVSVVIPYYNKKDTILRSVNSVIGQTYTNWELIIIDDCGEESLSEIELPKDERIQTYQNYYNLGAGKTRQRGLDLANGDFIAFLDADDWWDIDFMLLGLKAVINNPNSDGAYFQTYVYEDSLQGLRRYNELFATNIIETLISHGKPWQTGSILWRKEVCSEWGFLSNYEDYWFEITSAKANKLIPMDKIGIYQDLTGENHLSGYIKLSNATIDQQLMYLELYYRFNDKVNYSSKIILFHRLIRGQLKITEYCSSSTARVFRDRLFEHSKILGFIGRSRRVLKLLHYILQKSPFKIHY